MILKLTANNMKSEYRKAKEKKRVLVAYIVVLTVLVSLFIFSGRVQKDCIEANGVALCD